MLYVKSVFTNHDSLCIEIERFNARINVVLSVKRTADCYLRTAAFFKTSRRYLKYAPNNFKPGVARLLSLIHLNWYHTYIDHIVEKSGQYILWVSFHVAITLATKYLTNFWLNKLESILITEDVRNRYVSELVRYTLLLSINWCPVAKRLINSTTC